GAARHSRATAVDRAAAALADSVPSQGAQPRQVSLSVISRVTVSLVSAVALAQSPLGTITGTIADAQEARIPNVEVTALHTDTGISYKTTSSADGTYAVANLPVGKYEVSAVAPGFKVFRRTGVVLEVAQRLRLDIVLELGAVTETVTVTGEVSRVQTEQSTL